MVVLRQAGHTRVYEHHHRVDQMSRLVTVRFVAAVLGHFAHGVGQLLAEYESLGSHASPPPRLIVHLMKDTEFHNDTITAKTTHVVYLLACDIYAAK